MYTYKLNNRLNSYTIYKDGVELSESEVVDILNGLISERTQPSYYKGDDGVLSPLDCFREGLIGVDGFKGFCKGNIIKYVVRAGLKGDELEDYCKARDYLDELIETTKKP